MRFNRVLLLAASVNLAVLAMIFTISCSGDKGSSGAPGTSCTVQETETTYVFMCGGEKAGEVSKNGSEGPGGPGENGQGCTANKVGNTMQIICGGQVQGTLNDCSVKEGSHEYETLINCGTANFGLCYGRVFDTSTEECKESGTIGRAKCSNGSDLNAGYFCGYGSASDWAYDSVMVASGFEASREQPVRLCGENGKPNEGSWKNEYCRHMNEDPKSAVVSDEYCDDNNTINKDSWQKQYCGYTAQTADKRSVIGTGNADIAMCDDAGISDIDGKWYRGPNELAFGAGYCEAYRLVDDKGIPLADSKNPGRLQLEKTGMGNTLGDYSIKTRTRYSERFCGTIPVDGIPGATNKLNWKTWQGHGCGYATKVDFDSEPKVKSRVNICDDGVPNEDSWSDEYCEATREYVAALRYNIVSTDAANVNAALGLGDTITITKKSTTYCNDIANTANALNRLSSAKTDLRLSDKSGWSGQYCGYSYTAQSTLARQSGICLNGKGPNASQYRYEYCRVMSAIDPNKVEVSDTRCAEGSGENTSNQVNKDTWQTHYCGYATASDFTDGKKSRRNDAVCSDGYGVTESQFITGAFCTVLENDKDKEFLNVSTKTMVKGTWTIVATENDFCPTPSTSASNKMNDGSWKGEYCGYSNNTTATKSKRQGYCEDGSKPEEGQGDANGYCQVNSGEPSHKATERCNNQTLNEVTSLNMATFTKGGASSRQFCFIRESNPSGEHRDVCYAGYQPVSSNIWHNDHGKRCEPIGGYGSGSNPGGVGDYSSGSTGSSSPSSANPVCIDAGERYSYYTELGYTGCVCPTLGQRWTLVAAGAGKCLTACDPDGADDYADVGNYVCINPCDEVENFWTSIASSKGECQINCVSDAALSPSTCRIDFCDGSDGKTWNNHISVTTTGTASGSGDYSCQLPACDSTFGIGDLTAGNCQDKCIGITEWDDTTTAACQ